MTNVLRDVSAALFLAGGLLLFGWLLYGRLLTPVGKIGSPVVAVVPVSGRGEGLEHVVRGLVWLAGGGLARFSVVVADFGLDEAGLAAAQALQRREPALVICPAGALEDYIKGTTQDGFSRKHNHD